MQNWKPTDSLTGTLMEIRETDCERGTEKMEKTIEKKRKKEHMPAVLRTFQMVGELFVNQNS